MNRGFTLIELLVVIAIIGILSTISVVYVSDALERGKIARAQADLNQLKTAVLNLEADTNYLPGPDQYPGSATCAEYDHELSLDNSACAGGIKCDDGFHPGWQGPYMKNIPQDPWENNYIFDPDYTCHSATKGCEKVGDNVTVRALESPGPNHSAIDSYDSKEVVLILCVP